MTRNLVQRGRRLVDRILIDEGTITRGGTPTFNVATGDMEAPAGTLIYSGPMQLESHASRADSAAVFAEADVRTTNYVLDLPWDAPTVRINDWVTLTSSDDSDAVGLPFRVVSVVYATPLIRRSLGLELYQS